MSIKIMTEIWEHSPLKGTPLLLLLALADYANDQRFCWPSVATVAAKGRISERQAQRLLRALAEQEHIRVDTGSGRGGTNRYWLATVEKMKSLPEFVPPANGWEHDADVTPDNEGVTRMSPGGDTHDTRGETPVSPEPSLNHHRTVIVSEATPSLKPSDIPPASGEVPFCDEDEPPKRTRRKRTTPSSPAGESDAPEIPLHKEYFGVVCEICQMNASLNKGRVARVAKQLREAGIPLDVLRRVYAPGGWWWVNDWRGQRKQPPTPEAVLETIESARLAQAPPKRPIERSADGVIIMPVGGSRNG